MASRSSTPVPNLPTTDPAFSTPPVQSQAPRWHAAASSGFSSADVSPLVGSSPYPSPPFSEPESILGTSVLGTCAASVYTHRTCKARAAASVSDAFYCAYLNAPDSLFHRKGSYHLPTPFPEMDWMKHNVTTIMGAYVSVHVDSTVTVQPYTPNMSINVYIHDYIEERRSMLEASFGARSNNPPEPNSPLGDSEVFWHLVQACVQDLFVFFTPFQRPLYEAAKSDAMSYIRYHNPRLLSKPYKSRQQDVAEMAAYNTSLPPTPSPLGKGNPDGELDLDHEMADVVSPFKKRKNIKISVAPRDLESYRSSLIAAQQKELDDKIATEQVAKRSIVEHTLSKFDNVYHPAKFDK